MIQSFRHKGLKELFEQGSSKSVGLQLQARCIRRLTVIDSAVKLENINVPGFNLHSLRTKPQRHSVHVNGPWCITFEWRAGDAIAVDLEQYH
jgi:proteic killer suppression protein